jgi:hypothetical protein
MVPNAQRPSEPSHYKLYGVLYHHGEPVGSGYYAVDVLHPNGDGLSDGDPSQRTLAPAGLGSRPWKQALSRVPGTASLER